MLALSITDLKKTYANGNMALGGISLEIKKGDFFALLGPNGAGKSTLIGIINSLVEKSSGNVKIFDVDIDKNFPLAKSYLGIVPQEINFNQFETILEILTNQAGYYGISRKKALFRSEYLLNNLKLWERRNDISRELSGGMKRRLMIARALIHKPSLLLLDEPTAGVDIEIRHSMWNFFKEINNEGVTIILTTHYLEEAENLCRNLAIIDSGKIVINTSVRELLAERNKEIFIIECNEKYESLPNFNNGSCTQIDDYRFEISINRISNLDSFFRELAESDLKIQSIRNKNNRLEELFLGLTQNNE